jgi:TrmH family RNA methyltransferase
MARRPFVGRYPGVESVQTVTSRRHPVVGAFRHLARRPDPDGARLLLDGLHLIQEARQAGLAFEVLVVRQTRLRDGAPERTLALDLAARGSAVVAAADAVVAACSPLEAPSGVLAIVRRHTRTAEEALRGPGALHLAVADIQDPGNIGSLIRAAEAGGAASVLVCGASASPFSWKAVRGSMGSVLRLPVVAGLSASDAVAAMVRRRLRVVAAVPRHGLDPDEVDWRGPVGLLLGGEAAGLPGDLVAQCHARVSIPMAAPVESLNVAAAAAVLVYAARRQRAARMRAASGVGSGS